MVGAYGDHTPLGLAARAALLRRDALENKSTREAQIALQRTATDATVETGTYTRRMATWMLISVILQGIATLATIVISLLHHGA